MSQDLTALEQPGNGQLVEAIAAPADARAKLELFVRTVVQSKQLQASGGMMGVALLGMLPMVTTMLERAKPETVAGYCSVLAQAFALVADPRVSADDFRAKLSAWTPSD